MPLLPLHLILMLVAATTPHQRKNENGNVEVDGGLKKKKHLGFQPPCPKGMARKKILMFVSLPISCALGWFLYVMTHSLFCSFESSEDPIGRNQ